MRTFWGRPSTLFFGVLVVLDVVALAFLVLVFGGVFVDDPKGAATTAPTKTTDGRTTTGQPVSTRPPTVKTTTATTTTPTAPAKLRLVVRATRGDCWVSAKAGGKTGKVLYAQVLAAGDQMTVSARRIWLELGAGANVDVLVNGKPRAVNAGTSAVLLS
jgi:uncharacterized protein DUF4115